ncbi:MAG TPA: site-specific DNA-methyltransferase [Candidatus Lokiarchaeia archaeon]|nr:site-specific DNA-methyltransferase [Candidatus Lokiarchaeia archaeon]
MKERGFLTSGTSKSLRYEIIFASSEKIYPEDVPPESVKLVVTSPPYWDLKDYEVPGQIGRGDPNYSSYLARIEVVWEQVYSALAPDGIFCLNANTKFDGRAGALQLIPWDLATAALRAGFFLRDFLLWHKSTAIPRHDRDLKDNFEWVFLLTKTNEPLAYYGASEVTFLDYVINPPPVRSNPNMWNLNKKAGSVGIPGVRHPAIFHEDLPGRMIDLFTRPGDLVLDPFLGSGTTLAEAFRRGRACVGYEINNEDFWIYMREKFQKVLPANLLIQALPSDSVSPERAILTLSED